MSNEELIELAKKAREFSCATITKFKVGAALLTKSGKVFLGCNIEDRSFITNICAERCAIIKALSEGYNEFEKIAVVGGAKELVFCSPCGVCRQYLNSFGSKIKVICLDGENIEEYNLNELLPYSFNETFEN